MDEMDIFDLREGLVGDFSLEGAELSPPPEPPAAPLSSREFSSSFENEDERAARNAEDDLANISAKIDAQDYGQTSMANGISSEELQQEMRLVQSCRWPLEFRRVPCAEFDADPPDVSTYEERQAARRTIEQYRVPQNNVALPVGKTAMCFIVPHDLLRPNGTHLGDFRESPRAKEVQLLYVTLWRLLELMSTQFSRKHGAETVWPPMHVFLETVARNTIPRDPTDEEILAGDFGFSPNQYMEELRVWIVLHSDSVKMGDQLQKLCKENAARVAASMGIPDDDDPDADKNAGNKKKPSKKRARGAYAEAATKTARDDEAVASVYAKGKQHMLWMLMNGGALWGHALGAYRQRAAVAGFGSSSVRPMTLSNEKNQLNPCNAFSVERACSVSSMCVDPQQNMFNRANYRLTEGVLSFPVPSRVVNVPMAFMKPSAMTAMFMPHKQRFVLDPFYHDVMPSVFADNGLSADPEAYANAMLTTRWRRRTHAVRTVKFIRASENPFAAFAAAPVHPPEYHIPQNMREFLVDDVFIPRMSEDEWGAYRVAYNDHMRASVVQTGSARAAEAARLDGAALASAMDEAAEDAADDGGNDARLVGVLLPSTEEEERELDEVTIYGQNPTVQTPSNLLLEASLAVLNGGDGIGVDTHTTDLMLLRHNNAKKLARLSRSRKQPGGEVKFRERYLKYQLSAMEGFEAITSDPDGANISPALARILKNAAADRVLDVQIRHYKFDPTISIFGSMEVRWIQKLNYRMAMASSHRTTRVMWLGCMDAYRHGFDMHFNGAIGGRMAASKSYVLEIIEALLVRGAVSRFTYTTGKAHASKDNGNDKIAVYHEAPMSELVSKPGQTEGPSATLWKDRLTTSFIRVATLHINKDTGERVTLTHVAEQISVTLIATNDDTTRLSSALQSRFHWKIHEETYGTDRVIADLMLANAIQKNSEHGSNKESFIREVQKMHLLHIFVQKMIMCNIMPRVTTIACDVFMTHVRQYFSDNGHPLPGDSRIMQRMRIMCESLSIQDALESTFNVPSGEHFVPENTPAIKKTGFDMKDLLTVDGKLFVKLEHCVLAAGYLCEEYANPQDKRVLYALRDLHRSMKRASLYGEKRVRSNEGVAAPARAPVGDNAEVSHKKGDVDPSWIVFPKSIGQMIKILHQSMHGDHALPEQHIKRVLLMLCDTTIETRDYMLPPGASPYDRTVLPIVDVTSNVHMENAAHRVGNTFAVHASILEDCYLKKDYMAEAINSFWHKYTIPDRKLVYGETSDENPNILSVMITSNKESHVHHVPNVLFDSTESEAIMYGDLEQYDEEGNVVVRANGVTRTANSALLRLNTDIDSYALATRNKTLGILLTEERDDSGCVVAPAENADIDAQSAAVAKYWQHHPSVVDAKENILAEAYIRRAIDYPKDAITSHNTHFTETYKKMKGIAAQRAVLQAENEARENGHEEEDPNKNIGGVTHRERWAAKLRRQNGGVAGSEVTLEQVEMDERTLDTSGAVRDIVSAFGAAEPDPPSSGEEEDKGGSLYGDDSRMSFPSSSGTQQTTKKRRTHGPPLPVRNVKMYEKLSSRKMDAGWISSIVKHSSAGLAAKRSAVCAGLKR